MFFPEGSFLKLPGSSIRDSNFADDLRYVFFAADITDFFEDICRMNHMLRVAILDLYEGRPNEGMRCIQQILQEYSQSKGFPVVSTIYDVRLKEELPDLSYDIYLSSGQINIVGKIRKFFFQANVINGRDYGKTLRLAIFLQDLLDATHTFVWSSFV